MEIEFTNYKNAPVMCKLHRKEEVVTNVDVDVFSQEIAKMYDLSFDGTLRHAPYELPDEIKTLNENGGYHILAIIGASGRGKSTMLREFASTHHFANRELQSGIALISNFAAFGRDNAIARLSGVGLMSIPTWTHPANVLSVGERFRAELALNIESNTIFDEFTSTVDRNVARSCCNSLNKYIHRNKLHGVVVSTCHKDFIEYLRPDIVIDLDDECVYDCRNVALGTILNLRIERCNDRESWTRLFKHHHYLTANLNKACRFYKIYWDDVLVGCRATLPMMSAARNIYRGHRLVVLPDFQGLGIGVTSLMAMGKYYLETGAKFLSTRTSHVGLIRTLSNIPQFEKVGSGDASDNSAQKTRDELCNQDKIDAKIARLRAAGKTEAEIKGIMNFKSNLRDKPCVSFLYRGDKYARNGRYYVAVPDNIELDDNAYNEIEREIKAHNNDYLVMMTYGWCGHFKENERLERMLVKYGMGHTYYRSLKGKVSTVCDGKHKNVAILNATTKRFHDDIIQLVSIEKTNVKRNVTKSVVVVEKKHEPETNDEKINAIIDTIIDARLTGAFRYIDDATFVASLDDECATIVSNVRSMLAKVLTNARVAERKREYDKKHNK